MEKPFGMPGVTGWENGKWHGNDYLGFLTSNIGITVEVLETENVPKIDEAPIVAAVKEIFAKEGLTPKAEVEEGPPVPFFQLLIIVYPADVARYVIFTNGRLFESIDVKRVDFVPKGYWQGITWETQDIAMAKEKDLGKAIMDSAEKVAKNFVKRYREFNPTNPDKPKSSIPGVRPQ